MRWSNAAAARRRSALSSCVRSVSLTRAVICRVEMDMTYAEIARALGKNSDDSARMTVSRALVRLAKEMGDG